MSQRPEPPARGVLSLEGVDPTRVHREWQVTNTLWALLQRENEFLGHVNTAEVMQLLSTMSGLLFVNFGDRMRADDGTIQAVSKAIDARLDICRSLYSEQETQVKGLDVALVNLSDQLTY